MLLEQQQSDPTKLIWPIRVRVFFVFRPQVLAGLLTEDQACSWLKSLGDRALAAPADTGQLDRTALLQGFAQGATALLRQFPSETMCTGAAFRVS